MKSHRPPRLDITAGGAWLRRFSCAALLLTAGATAAHAQTYTWNGTTSSDYNTAANWTGAGTTAPPDTNTESANFSTTAGATTVNVSASTTTQNFLFTNTAPAYTFTGSPGATLTIDENIGTLATNSGIFVAATNPNLQTFALPLAFRNTATGGSQNFNVNAGAGGVLFTAASSLDLTVGAITTAFAGAGATSFNGSIAFGGSQQQFNFSGAGTTSNVFNPTSITATAAGGANFRLRVTGGTLNIANNYAVTVNGTAANTGTVEAGGTNGSAIAGNVYLTFTNDGATPFIRSVRLGSSGTTTATGGTVAFGANLTGGGTVFASGGIVLNSAATSSVNYQLFANAGTTLTETGVVSGGSNGTTASGTTLQILGGGTVVLSGANTYTSPTNVTAGTLLVNNTHQAATGGLAPGAYTVTNRATLGGTGTINIGGNAINIGNGTTGGIITGGAAGSVGLLTLTTTAATGVQFSGAAGSLSTYSVDLSATANANGLFADRLVISGALNLSGTNDEILFTSGVALPSGTYNLANYGSLSGTFDTVTNLPANGSLVYGATELDLVITPVPEPATWVGASLLGVALLGRALRRRHQHA